MEIGSLKALGYRNREIASIFITYATVASLTGALLGLAVGYYLFPKIIFDAYGQMYNILISYTVVQITVYGASL